MTGSWISVRSGGCTNTGCTLLLLLLTLMSTTVVGARLAENFRTNQPADLSGRRPAAYRVLLANPARGWTGWPSR